MPEWLPIVGTLLGTVLLVGGGMAGSAMTNKVAKRANETASVAVSRSAENDLIDQLQEELSQYRIENNERATGQDRRMQTLEDRNIEITTERDILRDYAHQLRSDIFSSKPPPPAEWPPGVYR
jgi:siroheme synthase (precorrin-2 oxidase/ferrochelatase)